MPTFHPQRYAPWLGILFAALLIGLAPVPAAKAAPQTHQVHLTAAQFAYEPGVIRVNPGDQVTIQLTALDVVHGLAIDGYDLEMTADPGQTAEMSFIADRPGVFRFRCSVTCGGMHPFMIGKLQVGPNMLYWRMAALSVLALVAGFWKVRSW